jgi:hypothetical protein
VFDQPTIASGTGLERDLALRTLHRMGANEERIGWSGEAKKISDDLVFGTGSRSALIVLMTLGNAVRADPVEGSGVP